MADLRQAHSSKQANDGSTSQDIGLGAEEHTIPLPSNSGFNTGSWEGAGDQVPAPAASTPDLCQQGAAGGTGAGPSITHTCHARVGLLGNPSDGYFGKTISFSLANFHARVTLRPRHDGRVCVVPHPLHDGVEFASLDELASKSQARDACGGVRLLLSLCRVFAAHCAQHGIELPVRSGFSLDYETNIPRQAGLSGSSAIVCAALNCLLDFYSSQSPRGDSGSTTGADGRSGTFHACSSSSSSGEDVRGKNEAVYGNGDGDVKVRIPLEQRPALVLRAETELGITAGLQDRVIQVYGGLVYMDFSRELMRSQGHGSYERMDERLLPQLHIVLADNPSDSGRVHSTVRQRWDAGDDSIRRAMEEVASLAEEGRRALESRDVPALAHLMNRNFDLRRQMFGDEALGQVNIEMVNTARSVGAAAKFPGSGGAVVVLCPEGPKQVQLLTDVCVLKGFQVVEAHIAPAVILEQ